MNVSIKSAGAASASARPLETAQSFPVSYKPGETGTTIGLGRSWPSKPQALVLNGQKLGVHELDSFWAWVPRLPVGIHPATLILADGQRVSITLDVVR